MIQQRQALASFDRSVDHSDFADGDDHGGYGQYIHRNFSGEEYLTSYDREAMDIPSELTHTQTTISEFEWAGVLSFSHISNFLYLYFPLEFFFLLYINQQSKKKPRLEVWVSARSVCPLM